MILSIIMPCYNVATTLERALDSIINQRTNFEYEIVIVDDGSTDSTVTIAQKYSLQYKNMRILCNEINRGNAYTFYTGLTAAKGRYFCVLDGDDYYTIPDKLQRQVDFLESDLSEEYVAVATQYIIDLGNGLVSIPDRSTYKEFSYVDFLTQHSGYYHTATYMYRNIFKGNVPDLFKEELYRGDTPRTTFHLMYSGKKVKILDFVGSAYTFEFSGIWSSLKQKQQFEYQVNYQTEHKKRLNTEFERVVADRLIEFNKKKMTDAQDDFRRYPSMTIDQALLAINKYANKFAFGQKDFVLQHVYHSSYIDTLCASLGYINDIHNAAYIQTKVDKNNICIINGVLNPHGGGIFAEINELIDIYKEKRVFLFVTNMDVISDEIKEIMTVHENLTIICPPKEIENKLMWFKEKLAKIAPYQCYCYCSHNDAYGVALTQSGLCKNIALFSFDHGYLCGISNPNLDIIIAKRAVDYWLLKKAFKDKVIYIPTWNKGAQYCENYNYEPFRNHDKLVTASGAARFYKIDGLAPKRYIEMIIDLLDTTKGKHYHFGEFTEAALVELREKMKLKGISKERFIHISWSDNIPLDLLKNNVDIFIEPFPVVSYKLTLEVLSVGIPVIIGQGATRMSIADFVPDDTLIWHDEREFIDLLTNINSEELRKKSKSAKEYFYTYHSVKSVSQLLFEGEGIVLEKEVKYPDNTLLEISDSLHLFGEHFCISFVSKANTGIKKNDNKNNREESQNSIIEQISIIRKSKSFKIGFMITLPLRIIKQTILYSNKHGMVKGIKKMHQDNLLFYHRTSPEEELKILCNSAAFKCGECIARPYRVVKDKLKLK